MRDGSCVPPYYDYCCCSSATLLGLRLPLRTMVLHAAVRYLIPRQYRVSASRWTVAAAGMHDKCRANNAQLSPIPWLERASLLFPDRTAIKYGNHVALTYKELMVSHARASAS